jgi:hypothetical protein
MPVQLTDRAMGQQEMFFSWDHREIKRSMGIVEMIASSLALEARRLTEAEELISV